MCVLNIGILEFYITEFLLRHLYHLDPIEANYFVWLEIIPMPLASGTCLTIVKNGNSILKR